VCCLRKRIDAAHLSVIGAKTELRVRLRSDTEGRRSPT
jgi:hypothetical protein